jgi:hypothetical protein
MSLWNQGGGGRRRLGPTAADCIIGPDDHLVIAFPEVLQRKRLPSGPCRALQPDSLSFLESRRVG